MQMLTWKGMTRREDGVYQYCPTTTQTFWWFRGNDDVEYAQTEQRVLKLGRDIYWVSHPHKLFMEPVDPKWLNEESRLRGRRFFRVNE